MKVRKKGVPIYLGIEMWPPGELNTFVLLGILFFCMRHTRPTRSRTGASIIVTPRSGTHAMGTLAWKTRNRHAKFKWLNSDIRNQNAIQRGILVTGSIERKVFASQLLLQGFRLKIVHKCENEALDAQLHAYPHVLLLELHQVENFPHLRNWKICIPNTNTCFLSSWLSPPAAASAQFAVPPAS